MAITTTWKFYLKQYSHNIELTSRTLGAYVNQDVRVGTTSRGTAVIDIDNNDGAFTPLNGGTYSDLDAYSYGLFVEALVDNGSTTTTRQVFSGVVSDFVLRDDGINSTVRLEAVDLLTLAGRSKVEFLNLDPDIYFFRENMGIARILNGYVEPNTGSTIFEPVNAPLLGAGATTYFVVSADVQTVEPFIQFKGFEDYTVADLLNGAVLPVNPAVLLCGRLEFEEMSGVETSRINTHLFDGSKAPTTDYKKDFVFDPTPTGTELPFSNLDRGYNADNVVNSAQVTRADPLQFGGAATQTKTHQSTESVERFGRHNIAYSKVAIRWDNTTLNNDVLEPGAQQTAERWSNMYDTPRFTTRSFRVSSKQVEAKAADTAINQWADYLDAKFGQWNTAKIVYTPTGGASRTDNIVVAGRSINISPSDAVFTVRCLPMQDNMNLILDDTQLGKLGGTADTYDDTNYVYDELFGYDGHPVEGNRIY
jgi:hypothetical protein